MSTASLLAASCVPTYRAQFIDLNYPEPSDAPLPKLADPTALTPLRVQAVIAPTLLTSFDDPNAAAACLRGFSTSASLAPLRTFGGCVHSTGALPALPCMGAASGRFDACLATSFAPLSCSCVPRPGSCDPSGPADILSCTAPAAALPAACSALAAPDRTRMLVALAHAGEAMTAYELYGLGPNRAVAEATVIDRALPAELASEIATAFQNAANILGCDATNGSTTCKTTVTPVPRKVAATAPTLALSSGAANGAFIAGYAYELLAARGAAKVTNPLAANDRFGAVVGTSVGALVAQLVDLVLVDAPLPGSALGWCQARAGLSSLPADAETCGLALLKATFTAVNEWDLLCVEDASFTEFLAPPTDPNDRGKACFGRFWPLERDFVRPFVEHFGDAVMANGTTRVLMTTDTESGTMLAQDERVCRSAVVVHPANAYSCSNGGPGELAGCLDCGVLSSVPFPPFAQPTRHVWTGLRSQGESGTFFDGALTSAFPVLRAVEMSALEPDLSKTVPVLALGTERNRNQDRTTPRTGVEVALAALTSLIHESFRFEFADATAFQDQRRLRARLPSAAVNATVMCRPDALQSNPASVLSVPMPADIDPPRLLAQVYQFDPIVMKGLFLLGRRALLEQATDTKRNVLTFLGWDKTKVEVEKVDGTGKTWLTKRRTTLDAEWLAWRATFPNDQAAWDAHVRVRRDAMEDALEDCPSR